MAAMVEWQGVVTYVLPVEAFATGIKMESSNQRSFFETIKGSRRILTNMNQRTFLDTTEAWLRFYGQHVCDYPCAAIKF